MHRPVPLLIVLLVLSACSASIRGVVRPGDQGPQLQEMQGRTWLLQPQTDEAHLLRFLDGEEVVVEGSKRGRTLKADRWSLREGTHGLQAFYGPLLDGPNGFGVQDQGSQAFYTIDDDAVDLLIDHVGKPVVLEGYVEGAQAVRVVYYRVLAAPEAAP